MRKLSICVCLVAAALMAACKAKSPSEPTPPTDPSPNNRSPVISSVTVTPGFGISDLTMFNYSASATDPDGDSVSYTWDLAGTPATGNTGSISFTGSGSGVLKVTVSDGRGGTATDSRTVTVASAGGTWRGSAVKLGAFTMALTQAGSKVTGSYADSVFANGQVDPARPGTINESGHVEMTMKRGFFTDVIFRGDLDLTGTRITGQIFGTGFNGEAFTMDKQ
jgi:Big-like domain-containing protein